MKRLAIIFLAMTLSACSLGVGNGFVQMQFDPRKPELDRAMAQQIVVETIQAIQAQARAQQPKE